EQRQQLQLFQTNGKLTVLELTALEIQAAFELPTQCNLKRITDKSVLLKAIHLQCMVLSGDRDLRKECSRHGLEVHGSIWVVREIWLSGLAEANLLMAILELLGRNGRLPGEEVGRLKNEITGNERDNSL
ncbi:MAG: hypothetical protein ACKV1O_29460, partial [Saprospiraceae bacterium]